MGSPDSSQILKYFSRKKKPLELSTNDIHSSSTNSSPISPIPPTNCSFQVAVSEDKNTKCRRTMEDAHTIIYNFGDIADSGYFALFDGHAGSACAEWSSKRLHFILDTWIKNNDKETLRQLQRKSNEKEKKRTDITPAHALGSAFLEIDSQIGRMNMQNAGTTAAVAVIRWEDKTTLVPTDFHLDSIVPSSSPTNSSTLSNKLSKFVKKKSISQTEGITSTTTPVSSTPPTLEPSSSSSTTSTTATTATSGTTASTSSSSLASAAAATRNRSKNCRRMLYVANVGDSRVVLCRSGKAYRLTYDHKGSDPREQKRITNNGGIMMNNRVNGVLAVTRSLGDTYMKDLVTGAPYTTESQICRNDEFLIIACDGLWDVCSDQKACDLVRNIKDPKEASSKLVQYALENFSTDNLTVMVVRLDQTIFDDPNIPPTPTESECDQPLSPKLSQPTTPTLPVPNPLTPTPVDS